MEKLRIYWILNAYSEPLNFELPKLEAGDTWRRWIDTALDSPYDIVPWQTATEVSENAYRAEARSVIILFASGKTVIA